MKIVADANILDVAARLETVAELELVPGREITRSHLLDADALLVRSITRVDRALLAGTAVRFVGTATSGCDHIDLDYLATQQIQFVDARGSNANAVVDYCFTALAYCVLNHKLDWNSCRIGLIGAGNVGGRFAARLEALQIPYCIYDPPLEAVLSGGNREADTPPVHFRPALESFGQLQQVLDCDVISLHVPLVNEGSYPTSGMIGAPELQRLRPNSVLINTCRGAVINERAFGELLQVRSDLTCIVDVWEQEPKVRADLVRAVDIATPHIAGYSQDAKLAATTMLVNALSRNFDLVAANQTRAGQKSGSVPVSPQQGADSHWQLLEDILQLALLSARFKTAAAEGKAAAQFDSLRKQLLDRREFSSYKILRGKLSEQQLNFLSILGFNPA